MNTMTLYFLRVLEFLLAQVGKYKRAMKPNRLPTSLIFDEMNRMQGPLLSTKVKCSPNG